MSLQSTIDLLVIFGMSVKFHLSPWTQEHNAIARLAFFRICFESEQFLYLLIFTLVAVLQH